jgi:TP901 family phage tail tape measure protein
MFGDSTNDAGQSMKDFTSLAKKAIPVVVALAGAKALGAAVKEAAELEKVLSSTKALIRPTAKELGLLEDQARMLGKTTAFTAAEAGSAFVELGKLGLETSEILAASTDVLSLASAANTDLGTAALATAKTMNQFGLAAEEAGRVTDVIAEASASSAIDIINFQEAMKLAGATASGLGTGLEEATGAISVLADRGLHGTMAGTGLSRTMIQMADSSTKAGKMIKELGLEGATFTEKLKGLKDEGLSTSEVFDMFGAIAGKSALQLINNADAVEELTEKYKEADGAAKDMADTQIDNLDGSTKILKSAFSDLKTEIGKIFSPATRTAVDNLTEAINFLSDATAGFEVFINQRSALRQTWLMQEESVAAVGKALGELADIEEERGKKLLRPSGENRRIAELEGLIKSLTGENVKYGKTAADISLVGMSLKQVADAEKILKKEGLDRAKAGLEAAKDKTKQEKLSKEIEAEEKAIALAKQKERARKKAAQEALKEAEKADKAAEKAARAAKVLKDADDKIKEDRLKILRELTLARSTEEEKAIFLVQEKWNKALENEKLTEAERLKIKRQSKAEEIAIRQEFRDKEAKEASDFRNKQRAAERQARDEKLEDERDLQQAMFGLAQESLSAIDTITSAVAQSRISDIDMETQARIKAVNDSTKSEKSKQKEIEEIEKKAAEERKKIRLKEWKADVATSIGKTALGVANALSSGVPPVNFINAASVAVAGGAATGQLIANKPKFRRGQRNSFGEYNEVPRSFGGAPDSVEALVSPGEVIFPPGPDAEKAKAAVNGTQQPQVLDQRQFVISVPVNGDATEETVEKMKTAAREVIKDVLENADNENFVNEFLVGT